MTTNEPNNAHDDDDDFLSEEEIIEASLEITLDDAALDALAKGDDVAALMIGANDLLTLMMQAFRDEARRTDADNAAEGDDDNS